MLKTVKSKVIAGALVVGLVSGGGAVLGATDAGAQLKSWYDGQFKKSSELVSAEVAKYGAEKVDGLVDEYNGLKDKTSNKLAERGEVGKNATNSNVDKRASEHIDAIKEQKMHIESYLSGQFKLLSDYTAGLISEAGNKALKEANEDLTKHAGTVGVEVQDQMEKAINENTEQAISDLEETISAAKSELQAQLDKNADLTIEEIKGLIDAKINELRTQITKINNDLIRLHDKTITMTAKSLLLKAQSELDAIVNNMNK